VARTPYVIVYRIDLGDEDELIVLRVYHAAPGPVGGRGLASAWFCCPGFECHCDAAEALMRPLSSVTNASAVMVSLVCRAHRL
jgi:hypothetical protein